MHHKQNIIGGSKKARNTGLQSPSSLLHKSNLIIKSKNSQNTDIDNVVHANYNFGNVEGVVGVEIED